MLELVPLGVTLADQVETMSEDVTIGDGFSIYRDVIEGDLSRVVSEIRSLGAVAYGSATMPRQRRDRVARLELTTSGLLQRVMDNAEVDPDDINDILLKDAMGSLVEDYPALVEPHDVVIGGVGGAYVYEWRSRSYVEVPPGVTRQDAQRKGYAVTANVRQGIQPLRIEKAMVHASLMEQELPSRQKAKAKSHWQPALWLAYASTHNGRGVTAARATAERCLPAITAEEMAVTLGPAYLVQGPPTKHVLIPPE